MSKCFYSLLVFSNYKLALCTQLGLVLNLTLILGSCRLNTDALTTVDTLARNLPNIIIEDVIYREIKSNKLSEEIQAREFRVFSRQRLVEVEEGSVKTFSQSGEPELEGSAAAATFDQDSEDADITGPIKVYYFPDATTVRAGSLEWNSEERLLQAQENQTVEVSKDDGTSFTGKGFFIDMKSKTVEYQQQVEGELFASPASPASPEDSVETEGGQSE